MDRYIGLDVHASSCALAVVGPSGKRLGSHVVETNARALIGVLRGMPRNRHVCLEEGTLSGGSFPSPDGEYHGCESLPDCDAEPASAPLTTPLREEAYAHGSPQGRVDSDG